jgi:hypothetical protein
MRSDLRESGAIEFDADKILFLYREEVDKPNLPEITGIAEVEVDKHKDGPTGRVKPFSRNDNGGDLVESAFLVQGLLCVRQYFRDGSPAEQALAKRIDRLWRSVEWDWYQRGRQNVLYWHWSPDKSWAMNFPIEGYNECLITYVLAASSPTHPIPAAAYHEGWARGGRTDAHVAH